MYLQHRIKSENPVFKQDHDKGCEAMEELSRVLLASLNKHAVTFVSYKTSIKFISGSERGYGAYDQSN